MLKRLETEVLILPEEPVLPENLMAHQWKMWDLHMTAVIKSEETLRQNMHSLYAVMMSLCDSNMEDKVKMHEDYAEIKCTRNSINFLQVIKQYMYSNGSEELHTFHNQVMYTISLFQMRQEGNQCKVSRAIYSNATRVIAIGSIYWSIGTGGKGSTEESRHDRSDN